ncbi:MAG: cytochrome b [Arenicella sp.]|jgi:cytochrome b
MTKRVAVWDLPTRLFHWCLVLSVFYSWLSVDVLENMQHHFYSGYVVLTLLLFRLIWGVVGSYHSRFTSFLFSASETINYAKSLGGTGSGKRYLGHNPLGSISAVLMILVLLAQAALGLFSSDDYFFGPLSGLVSADSIARLSELHLLNSNAIFALIGLHVVAIIYYKVRKRESLTSAMLSGNKALRDSQAPLETKPVRYLLALIILLLCAALVYFLVTAYLDVLPSSTGSYY